VTVVLSWSFDLPHIENEVCCRSRASNWSTLKSEWGKETRWFLWTLFTPSVLFSRAVQSDYICFTCIWEREVPVWMCRMGSELCSSGSHWCTLWKRHIWHFSLRDQLIHKQTTQLYAVKFEGKLLEFSVSVCLSLPPR